MFLKVIVSWGLWKIFQGFFFFIIEVFSLLELLGEFAI